MKHIFKRKRAEHDPGPVDEIVYCAVVLLSLAFTYVIIVSGNEEIRIPENKLNIEISKTLDNKGQKYDS